MRSPLAYRSLAPLAAAVLLGPLAMVVTGGAAVAQNPGRNGVIAYVRDGGGLFTVNPDGTNARRIAGGDQLVLPAWSPDGTKVAFARSDGAAGESYRNLWVANADGSGPVQLTSGQTADRRAPTWSPDGTRIAYVSGSDLVVANADGSNEQLLVSGTAATGSLFGGIEKPSWSPDGTTIAYYTYGTPSYEIFSVPATGGTPTQLTHVAAGDHANMHPDYSPDGTRIAYVSDAESCTPYCRNRLWVMDADGTHQHLVDPEGQNVFTPSWSPDGRQIVFADYDAATGDNRIFTVNADGSGRSVIADGAPAGTQEFYTAWQPAPSVATPPGSLATTVTGGQTVTTDPSGGGATATVPVQTSITVPAGVSGALSVTPQPLGSPPSGYDFFGTSLALEGPVASAATPYTVAFTVDASALAGIAPADVQVFRNGTALTGCTDASAAVPDPCLVSRGFVPGGAGDAQVVVRTSHFSTWNIGKLSYTLKAGLEPVNLPPVVNTAKAGSAIPVRFTLGGNRGLDVFAAGFPKASAVACGRGPEDAIEVTVPLTTSVLLFEPFTKQYVYVWKTDKSWRGCRDLTLTFKDGSSTTARFMLR
ncbi:MAG: TolB protein [Actinomycetota bacterium]|jgi:hypothetical protein|nr:TolB protein [Actinomycetota bacterium]